MPKPTTTRKLTDDEWCKQQRKEAAAERKARVAKGDNPDDEIR